MLFLDTLPPFIKGIGETKASHYMSFRNFATVRTDMPCWDKNRETFLSNLISSSLVTRYDVSPFIAVSMIRLSSLSRQILISPEIRTYSALSSMSVRSSRISSGVISYLSLIFGRLRTSTISSSIGSEITAAKSPFSKCFLSLAGYPKGLIKQKSRCLYQLPP